LKKADLKPATASIGFTTLIVLYRGAVQVQAGHVQAVERNRAAQDGQTFM
jgi:hypothetical protein